MVAVGALVNRPLTSMIWLEEVGDQGGRRPQGQDDRHRRHPLPGRLPEDDPRPRQALARATSRRSTSASACCRRSSAAAPRRCSAATATSRGSTCGCAARSRSITPVDQLGVPTYDELVLVANRKALEEDPERSGSSSPRWRAAPTPPATTRRRRPRRCSKPTSGLDPKLTEAEVEATLPLLSAARAPNQPYGYMDPEEWGDLHRLDARQRADRVAAAAERTAQQRLPLGRNPRIARARPSPSRRLTSLAGIAAWKRWPWA